MSVLDLLAELNLNLSTMLLFHLHNRTGETVLQFKHVDERTVLEYIKNLKQVKSAGPDPIPTIILKHAADTVCKPLTMHFNSKAGNLPRQMENNTNYINFEIRCQS